MTGDGYGMGMGMGTGLLELLSALRFWLRCEFTIPILSLFQACDALCFGYASFMFLLLLCMFSRLVCDCDVYIYIYDCPPTFQILVLII